MRATTFAEVKSGLFRVRLSDLCTPGMGVSSWGENPLYENLRVFIIMDTTKSISRRQGLFREKSSEGSRSANVRVPSCDGIVHGKFTSLSGEICLSSDRNIMREIRKRFTRLTNDPAYLLAVDGYESRNRETRNRQQLVNSPIAPCIATCRVSKSRMLSGYVMERHSLDLASVVSCIDCGLAFTIPDCHREPASRVVWGGTVKCRPLPD